MPKWTRDSPLRSPLDVRSAGERLIRFEPILLEPCRGNPLAGTVTDLAPVRKELLGAQPIIGEISAAGHGHVRQLEAACAGEDYLLVGRCFTCERNHGRTDTLRIQRRQILRRPEVAGHLRG